MESGENVPDLDAARIEWPTGQVTVGQMREVEPGLLDETWLGGKRVSDVELFDAYAYELLAAQKAFALAMGREDPYRGVSRGDILEFLGETYGKYGITTGKAQTRELLRRIEGSAIAQAIEHGGRDPRRSRGGGEG